MKHLKLFEEVTGDLDKMVDKVNNMLKSYNVMKQDRKKWAARYSKEDLFNIASKVIDGKIKNKELKDKIADFISKK